MCVCPYACVCVSKPSHSSSSTLVYKSKSSLETCLLAIHNITHSLSFWTIHIIRTTKAGTIAWWKGEPSFLPSPPLLPLYSPSLELAFSAASWNVSVRRVRSQGRFSAQKKPHSDRSEGGGVVVALTDVLALWPQGWLKITRENVPWESHPPTAHHPRAHMHGPGRVVGNESIMLRYVALGEAEKGKHRKPVQQLVWAALPLLVSIWGSIMRGFAKWMRPGTGSRGVDMMNNLTRK